VSTETFVDAAELRDVVADVLDVDPAAVTLDAGFVDLGVDSLLALELAVSLERRYQVRIDATDIVGVRCLRDARDLLDGKLRDGRQPGGQP
jgi:acyl carrier protein